MDFSTLEKRIDVTFENKDVLKQALTHRGFLNDNRGWKLGHNERLEFLGDSVLELVVTAYLFNRYEDAPEGKLTEYRSALVNIQVLSTLAKELGLNDFILLSNGEAKDATGRARQIILGDAFEALIGAIYFDRGLGTAHRFVTKYILSRAEEFIAKDRLGNSKGALQMIAQEKLKMTPTYAVLEQKGPDHDRQFVVGVYFGSELIATGQDGSKKLAEVQAAKAALDVKGWTVI